MAHRHRADWRRSTKIVATGWAVPFTIMFAQVLLVLLVVELGVQD
jgi:hypothetical protein